MFTPFNEYVVYSNGTVLSEKNGKRHWLKLQKINSGYFIVRMKANGVETKWLVHRLIAMLFVSNPHNYPVVNHIDGNRENNDYRNLEWTTQRGNVLLAQSKRPSTFMMSRPFEIYNLETSEDYVFSDFKSALQYSGCRVSRYVYNEKLRRDLRNNRGEFIPIPFSEWMIRINPDYLIDDFDWPVE